MIVVAAPDTAKCVNCHEPLEKILTSLQFVPCELSAKSVCEGHEGSSDSPGFWALLCTRLPVGLKTNNLTSLSMSFTFRITQVNMGHTS